MKNFLCVAIWGSILLLHRVAQFLETIDMCIWCMFDIRSVVVTVWRSVGMSVV